MIKTYDEYLERVQRVTEKLNRCEQANGHKFRHVPLIMSWQEWCLVREDVYNKYGLGGTINCLE